MTTTLRSNAARALHIHSISMVEWGMRLPDWRGRLVGALSKKSVAGTRGVGGNVVAASKRAQ